MKRRLAVIAVLWGWLVLLLLTHSGARSPYSYGWAIFGGKSAHLLGAVVNPDALPVQMVTLFFYDGEMPRDWHSAHNFRLALHSFVTATVAGLTRSYPLANLLANLLFAMIAAIVAVSLARRHDLSWPAIAVALLTVLSLPFFVTYIGQPMHYMVGTVISFLVVLAVAALEPVDLRKPLISGLATAILTLNYDPYVYAAAVAVYVITFVRFRRPLDSVVYLAISFTPVVVWDRFINAISGGQLSTVTQTEFIQPVFRGWFEFLRHPLEHVLLPFVASHAGVHLAAHQIIAMIYWPLVAVCAIGLARYRPRPHSLIVLLPVVFVLHQVATAAFDWENNPRRALGVVLAFGYAWCWLAGRVWSDRRWRAAFVALLAMSALLAFSDAIFKSPLVAYLSTGQAMQRNPKDGVQIEKLRLETESMPALMRDERLVWRDLGKARLPVRWGVFAFAQLFNAFFVAGLFWLLSRARLMPRYAHWFAAAVWLVSMVRFA